MAIESLGLGITAQTAGTAEIEKLVAAMNKYVATAEAAQKKTKDSGTEADAAGQKFSAFADKVKSGLTDPLGTAQSAAGGLLDKMGALGVGITAGAAVIGTFATVAFGAAKSLGELGDKVGDIAFYTGLSTKEVGQFSFAMKRAGGDIETLLPAMRTLSKGLSENSEEGKAAKDALGELGVRTREVTGELRKPSDILIDISKALGGMTDAADRNVKGMAIFGRAWMSLGADLVELNEGIKRAKDLGIGMSEAQVAALQKYQSQVVELEAAWSRFAKKFKEPLAAVLTFTLNWANGASGIDPGKIDPRLADLFPAGGPNSADREMAETQGFGYGATGSVSTRRAGMRSISRGQGIIAAARASRESTRAGLEDLLGEARKEAATAYSALQQAAGRQESEVQKLRSAWDRAAASVARYEARLKGIQSAEKFPGIVDASYMRMFGGVSDPLSQSYLDEQKDIASLAGAPASQVDDLRRMYRENRVNIAAQMADEQARRRREMGGYVPGDSALGGLNLAAIWGQLGIAPENVGLDEKGAQKAAADALSRQLSTVKELAEYQIRYNNLIAGPGGEVAAIRQAESIRLAALEQRRKLGDDEWTISQERARVLRDSELQLLELRNRGRDQYASSVQALFRAGIAGGGGIGSALKSQGLGILDQMVGNVAKQTWTSASSILGGAGEKSGLPGWLLAGTLFDPQNKQLTAANIQMQAAAMQLQAAGAAMGGGAVGGMLGGLPGIFGGGGGFSADGSTWSSPGGILQLPAGAVRGGMTGLQRSVGIAGAAGMGALGIYAGIREGGARGAIAATGSALGAGGGIIGMIPSLAAATGPLAPILMAAGLGLGLVHSLFGDPKQKRARQIDEMLDASRYTEVSANNFTTDASGRFLDYDKRGTVRVYVNAPVNVSAMDSRSFLDRREDIASAMNAAIRGGHEIGFTIAERAALA